MHYYERSIPMEYNEATKRVLNQLLKTDAWRIEGKDIFQDTNKFVMDLERRNLILEGVQHRLSVLGRHFDDSDISSIHKELNERYKAMGIESGVPRTVKDWIRLGKDPNDAPSYRENLYELCMALEMSVEETKVFFKKFYMTIPFNYKNRVDAAYYYGIKHGYKCAAIKRILKEVATCSEMDNTIDESTSNVKVCLDAIEDEKLLIEYLRDHAFSREKQFLTARAKITVLEHSIAERLFDEENEGQKDKKQKKHLNESEKKEISEDKRVHHSIRYSDGSINYKELVYFLSGVNYQKDIYDSGNKDKEKESIAKCKALPKRFRENFPIDQIFTMIHKGLASADQYRKALILLIFHDFFYEQKQSYMKSKHSLVEYENRTEKECMTDYNDFVFATNDQLVKCGFSELYARHPFDWLILYCAHCSDPRYIFCEMLDFRIKLHKT